MRYRNTRTGRVIERPMRDEWLEASSGWTREEEPHAEPEAEPTADEKQEEEQ